MEKTSETMSCGARFDDTIQHFQDLNGALQNPVAILSPIAAKVSKTMDCDKHPSCDCYSQCNVVVW